MGSDLTMAGSLPLEVLSAHAISRTVRGIFLEMSAELCAFIVARQLFVVK